MKKLFIAIAALAAMTSCSQDETLDAVQGRAITFANAFVDNATRATTAADPSYGASAEKLTQFNVWGTVEGQPIFDGDKVSGTVGENSVWNCETTQYWVESAEYNFAALVNEGKVTLGSDKLPGTVEFTVTDGKTDLLYAKSNTYRGKKSTETPDLVAFAFDHLLSKVMFTVYNTSTAANSYSFLVKNIKVTGAMNGTCTVKDKSWNTTGVTATSLSFGEISVDGGATNLVCDSELLLIPGSVSVSFTVDIIYNGETIASHDYATTANHTLEVGKAYNFVIQVAVGNPIQFTVENYPTWENGNDNASTDVVETSIPLTVQEVQ